MSLLNFYCINVTLGIPTAFGWSLEALRRRKRVFASFDKTVLAMIIHLD